jgi:hypothetical protein
MSHGDDSSAYGRLPGECCSSTDNQLSLINRIKAPAAIVSGCLLRCDVLGVSLVPVPTSRGIKHLQTIDDLATEVWFYPKGYGTTVVNLDIGWASFTNIPGTATTLEDGFTFYFDDQSKGGPPNLTLLHADEPFYWKGDILVVKNRGNLGVSNITGDDIPLICSILQA